MAFIPAIPVPTDAATATRGAAAPSPRRKGPRRAARAIRASGAQGRGTNGRAGGDASVPPPFPKAFRAGGEGHSSGGGGEAGDTQKFEPFDGSRPLLPPWRPPTLEAAFSHRARGQSLRVRSEPSRRLVVLEKAGYATLYAHVVQDDVVRKKPRGGADADADADAADETVRVWLRPLLLDDPSGGFVDVRGGTDLVLPRACVRDVADPELRTRVLVNLAATEADVPTGGLGEAARAALLAFVRRLGEGGGGDN